MDSCANETPAEIIKEGTFDGTFVRDLFWY